MRFHYLALLFLTQIFAGSASATLISVTGPLSLRGGAPSIIVAPPDVNDGAASNIAQQGFDEVQNFVLVSSLAVDGGSIASGTTVSSHMIFLNNSSADGRTLNEHIGVKWTFDGVILGVMSEYTGSFEIPSSPFLGAPGTLYPLAVFNARGIESDDSYSFIGNVLTFNSRIRQPGDWIRVITATNSTDVPEPTTLLLLTGASALFAARRRKLQSRY